MKDAINELTGVELQRRYCDAQTIQTFGPEKGPFIVVDEAFQQVWVFGTRQLEVVETDFQNETQNLLMEDLLAQRAKFSVEPDGTVKCEIGSVTATSDSYASAGMRARRLASISK